MPRKNVLPLCGRPLIAWTIQAARAAELIGRVVVSTDDEEIADVSRRFGAEVVRRPADLSGDTAASEAAVLHTLEHLEAVEGYRPGIVAFLQCTSPLTTAEDIDGTIGVLSDSGVDSAVAVTPFHYFLWQWQNGEWGGVNHDKQVRTLRQERDPQYLETGAVYAMRTEVFREAGHRFCGRTSPYVMPRERCLEIDEPVDMKVAEVLMRQRLRNDQARALPDRIGAVVFDFDGVLTDDRVTVTQDGTEAVVCSRGDGAGIAHLRRMGVPMFVISAEVNPVVGVRCQKLGIPFRHGVEDKLAILNDWLAQQDIAIEDTIYIGNDVNDLQCLNAVGCGVAVGDAHTRAIQSAVMVLFSSGGKGAIRELADLVETKTRETEHAATT